MQSLTINVSDPALSSQTDQWSDGAEYQLRVRQTAPGVFDLVEVGPAEAEETAEEVAPAAPPMHKNPAIAIIMQGGRKK